ncbi:MAG: GGDEF domain-containing protein [Planctomycetota bacterium]|nr:MAG: GGDEF domain-containing protein [Planctomycetota bacterium]REJ87379.1 MAG: GGDEF domain-containing protein [Planctomycetota bacterium]REK27320.1 MAG: GGDEF domain-containing protein [Planctomycetota bacterium]REK36659.1 MAG: GGDEF domain-containing protein [Planctomycetota bacterium]
MTATRLILPAFGIVLAPACSGLVGTVAGAPLAAVAVAAPLTCAVAWVAGRWAGMGVAAASACGWYLPVFFLSGIGLSDVDHSSMLLGTGIQIAFALLTARWSDTLHAATVAAEVDPLTGLLNRRGIVARLEMESNRCRRGGRSLAVAFVDCDHFKAFNDSRGHAAGDRLLCVAAERLSSGIRNYDAAGRLGGDEFVVVFPECSEADARAAGARLLDSLRTAMHERGWPVTFSIGVAVFGTPGDAQEMLSCADAAMYEAKHSGKDRLCVQVGVPGEKSGPGE